MNQTPKPLWDKQLVQLFLAGFNKRFACAFVVKEWPEETEKAKRSSSPKKAVEAIAEDHKTRKTLAIEHTLLPPFTQQKHYDKRFQAIFGPLENSPSLTVPGFHVSLGVPVPAIPEKGNFPEISRLIAEWIRANISEKITKEGPWPDDLTFEAEREITNLGFSLKIDVRKQRIPGHRGGLHFISTFMPRTLTQEIERALRDKVPGKLAVTAASLRFLLLEQDNPPHTPWQIADELASVAARIAQSLPELHKIDSIWLADTRELRSHIWLVKIRPDGVEAAFTVECSGRTCG